MITDFPSSFRCGDCTLTTSPLLFSVPPENTKIKKTTNKKKCKSKETTNTATTTRTSSIPAMPIEQYVLDPKMSSAELAVHQQIPMFQKAVVEAFNDITFLGYAKSTLWKVIQSRIILWTWQGATYNSQSILQQVMALCEAMKIDTNCMKATMETYRMAIQYQTQHQAEPSTFSPLLDITLFDAGWWKITKNVANYLPENDTTVWRTTSKHGWAVFTRCVYFGTTFHVLNSICENLFITCAEADEGVLKNDNYLKKLFEDADTEIVPHLIHSSVTPLRERRCFHQGHEGHASNGNAPKKEMGINAMHSHVCLENITCGQTHNDSLLFNCDVNITQWQSECGNYEQTIIHILPSNNKKRKSKTSTTIKKSISSKNSKNSKNEEEEEIHPTSSSSFSTTRYQQTTNYTNYNGVDEGSSDEDSSNDALVDAAIFLCSNEYHNNSSNKIKESSKNNVEGSSSSGSANNENKNSVLDFDKATMNSFLPLFHFNNDNDGSNGTDGNGGSGGSGGREGREGSGNGGDGFVRGVSSTFGLEDENKILDELLEIGNLLPDFEGTDVIEPM